MFLYGTSLHTGPLRKGAPSLPVRDPLLPTAPGARFNRLKQKWMMPLIAEWRQAIDGVCSSSPGESQIVSMSLGTALRSL